VDFGKVVTMAETGSMAPAIVLTEKALKHLNKLRADQNKDLCLRVGVRQGGCSGMSYVMDFEEKSKLRPDDSVIEHEGFTMGMCALLLMFRSVNLQSTSFSMFRSFLHSEGDRILA
jgi:iron-sulfur cluster assembly protein